MAALALAIVGIAVNVIFGLIPNEWRAMHKRAVLWGRLGGFALLGVGLYMLLLSVIPPEWGVPMIARISIVVGAILLAGGLIGEFAPVSRAQSPNPGQPTAAPAQTAPRQGPHIIIEGGNITNSTRDNIHVAPGSNPTIEIRKDATVSGAGRDNLHLGSPGEKE